MNKETHSRAKEVFFGAVDLPSGERGAFLDSECGDDAELRNEVDSLLAHHDPDSLFEVNDNAETSGEDVLVVNGTHTPQPHSRVFVGKPARLLWILAAAAVLFTIGFVTHSRIERALLDIRANELTTVLDAEVHTLEIWIRDQKAQLGVLSQDPRVLRNVKELLAVSENADDEVAAWLQSPARSRLLELFESFMETTGAVGVEVLDARGVMVHASTDSELGFALQDSLLDELAVAFRGRTIFVRPYRFDDIVVGTGGGTLYSFVLGPLRDDNGRIIAALAGVQKGYGPGSISSLLEVTHLGESGETFAFDRDGLMLSESRFTDELRRLGLAPTIAEEGREWEAGAQLNVQIRDPGGDLVRGHVPELEVGVRPLTQLAAVAIAAREKTEPDQLHGVLLEPYRNYRGVEVIGAWRWLPEHGFGVATEIEEDEAKAPLRHLELVYGVLFALLTAFVAATLVSAFSVAGLRRRVRKLTTLGPYRLVARIAEGGMGVVYLAEHALLKRRTAVKVLSGELSRESVARFEREVSLASRLTHPNTIEIYDYGQTPEGVFYYAMEYVEGPTLSELVTRHGPPPPERAVHILKQVCGSLGEAHRAGLIHRDIKPQNIMLCSRGGQHDVVKVLDFGLVKDVTRAGTDDRSRGIHIGGTPLYMAPERVTSPNRIDARVDIYSLGCVAYYLLAGRPVFEHSNDGDLLDKIANAIPAQLADVSEQVIPRELEGLIMECLAKTPEDRPQSVFAVIERLEELADLDPWTQKDASRWWRSVKVEGRVDESESPVPGTRRL